MSRYLFACKWWMIRSWLIALPLFSDVATALDNPAEQDLTQLSIEQLMQQKVTSVSKSRQNFADSAAAVFVISAEDIKRSGATLVPEVLRLAPGLHVARISSNQWAITARGFNGRFSNKLLVLIDGRTVYTPIFSGVYWESLDLPLSDIKRIEVIRGPGASLWGANAVNGIVNIITKTAAESQGGLASVIASDNGDAIIDWGYGAQPTEALKFRISGRNAKRQGLLNTSGDDAGDDWFVHRGGVRADWQASARDSVTARADLYRLDLERNFSVPSGPDDTVTVLDSGDLSGLSVLTNWEHSFSLASRTTAQFYYQRENRDDLFSRYRQETFDFDFQHEFAITEKHTITWGLGHRLNRDDFDLAALFNILPQNRSHRLFGAFVQTQVSLLNNRLDLILGTKAEHNSFVSWEHQPSLKVMWKLAKEQRLWASIGRASRTPARSEHDESAIEIFQTQSQFDGLPLQVVFGGDSDFDSEKVTSFEIGYRLWSADKFFLDMAVFYNEYDDLRSAAPRVDGVSIGQNGVVQQIGIVNAEEGNSHGFEVGTDWRLNPDWRLRFGYSYLRSNFSIADVFNNVNLFPPEFGDDRSPRHQASIQSSINLPHNIELDLWLRYVDSIDAIQVTSSASGIASVDDYLTLDVRLGWQPSDRLELSISGRNLTDSPHLEFLKEINTVPTQVERSIFGQLKWRF